MTRSICFPPLHRWSATPRSCPLFFRELLDAMDAVHLEQPDAATWYGFGLIYEQYGVTDAAIAAYRSVLEPTGAAGSAAAILPDRMSVRELVRLRLQALHAG